MDDFDKMYEKAVETERKAAQVEPRAQAVEYAHGYLAITLMDGVRVMIPVKNVRELDGLSDEQLRKVAPSPSGEGIAWDESDIHISVPGLIWELFGSPEITRKAVTENARRAASTKTEARSQAARANGKKGGRPKRATAAG
jgi:hypothetical protein